MATSGACRSNPLRATSGLTNVSRLQDVANNTETTTTATTRTTETCRTEAAPLDVAVWSRQMRASSRSIVDSLFGEAFAELGLPARTIHHLPLELTARRVDVIAARAAHRRDHPGLVQQLLERTDRGVVRTLESRARERVERDQVDLRRILHLDRVVELTQQAHEL